MANINQDLAGALRARDRLVAIASEPALDHQAKLFAFCLAAFLNERRRVGMPATGWQSEVGQRMYPPDSATFRTFGPWGLVHRAIATDIPRYEIPKVPVSELRCVALKSRGPRAGLPCDNKATGHPLLDRDPHSGEQRWIGYCRNHTHPELDKWRGQRYELWRENGCPNPPANLGGVLAKHFPEGAWSRHYAWAAGARPTPGHDDEPETQAAHRPQLSVITGDGEAFDNTTQPHRANLTICDEP